MGADIASFVCDRISSLAAAFRVAHTRVNVFATLEFSDSFKTYDHLDGLSPRRLIDPANADRAAFEEMAHV